MSSAPASGRSRFRNGKDSTEAKGSFSTTSSVDDGVSSSNFVVGSGTYLATRTVLSLLLRTSAGTQTSLASGKYILLVAAICGASFLRYALLLLMCCSALALRCGGCCSRLRWLRCLRRASRCAARGEVTPAVSSEAVWPPPQCSAIPALRCEIVLGNRCPVAKSFYATNATRVDLCRILCSC